MRYAALAVDYDGTLASHGVVRATTLEALRALKRSGRVLLLVTGRRLDDLRRVFPACDIFSGIVAENGALMWNPETGEEKLLGDRVPPRFLDELERRGVAPLEAGRVIVATSEPHSETVLEVIRDLAIDQQVIFNKGALMMLPLGVDKASGLRAALQEFRVTPDRTVGIGDAENDEAFLRVCGYAVAVANALPSLKAVAHRVTRASNGAGVVEVIEELLEMDETKDVAETS